MKRHSFTTDESFDLLVVGGGINGAGVARDASLRGLRVALVEQSDFGDGTSSRSSRLIHGGLRYLENFQVGIVRECLRERATLLKTAPHVVRPLEFLLPLYGTHGRGRKMTKLGLTLYDLLARGGPLPKHRMLSPLETTQRDPDLALHGLIGGATYSDAITDDRRLVILNLVDAARHGASLANYTRVESLEGRSRISLRDLRENRQISIVAKNVVNATGPGADRLNQKLGINSPPRLRLSKGIHLAFPRRPVDHALLLQSPLDGRVFFVIPERDVTIVGTTETDYDDDPSDVAPDDEDIDYLIRSVESLLPGALFHRDRLLYAYAGLRPLVESGSKDAGNVSRGSLITDIEKDSTRILSLYGGKLTSYRAFAEEVVDKLTFSTASTAQVALPGGDTEDFDAYTTSMTIELCKKFKRLSLRSARHIITRYGTEWEAIAQIMDECESNQENLQAGGLEIGAEVLHAYRSEMATSLADVVLHRLTTERDDEVGLDAEESALRILAKEHQWDSQKKLEEREHCRYLRSCTYRSSVHA